MSSPVSFSTAQPFGDLPVRRHNDRWLLTTAVGILPVDQVLAMELDRFATAMAAADTAVDDLRSRSRYRG